MKNASNLLIFRTRLNISYKKLANSIRAGNTAKALERGRHVGRETVRRWEEGTLFPNILQAQEIARVLRVPMSKLWSADDVRWGDDVENHVFLKAKRRNGRGLWKRPVGEVRSKRKEGR